MVLKSIEGRNVPILEEVRQFQDIGAYISDVDKGFRIEFRAESYTELQASDINYVLDFGKIFGNRRLFNKFWSKYS